MFLYNNYNNIRNIRNIRKSISKETLKYDIQIINN